MIQDTPEKLPSINLGLLYPSQSLFTDTDGDGYTDTLHLELGIAPRVNDGHIWAGLINLAVRLNMECNGTEVAPPIITKMPQPRVLLVHPPTPRYKHATSLEQVPGGGWILSGYSPETMGRLLTCLATESIHTYDTTMKRLEVVEANATACSIYWDDDLAESHAKLPTPPQKEQREVSRSTSPLDLISISSVIFKTSKNDPRGCRLALGLELPHQISPVCAREVFSLMGAAAARATEIVLPIAQVGIHCRNELSLKLEVNKKPAALLKQQGDVLFAAGPHTALSQLLRQLNRLWFHSDASGGEKFEIWRNKLYEAALLAAGESDDGKLLHRLIRGEKQPSLPKEKWRKAASACRLLDGPKPLLKPPKKTIVRRSTWQKEVDRLLSLANTIPHGTGRLDCRVFLSGSVSYRNQFKATLNDLLQEKGYEPETSVFRAYKPAVSWLLEEVEPHLPQNVERLEISFVPFKKSGQMEMASRWVQEIYPAPDILCARRGFKNEQVTLKIEPKQDQTYVMRAFDGTGKLLKEVGFTPPVSRLPYLLEGKISQYTYPVCASIVAKQNARTVLSKQLPTDRQLFWQRFQQSWLPEIEKNMLAALPELIKENALSFWEEIRFDIAINDEQEWLDFAEERIAPLEALHEDIYFGLLNFSKAFCVRHGLHSQLNLGRIMPMVHSSHQANPEASLKLKPMQAGSQEVNRKLDITEVGYSRGFFTIELNSGKKKLTESECNKFTIAAKAWGHTFETEGERFFLRIRPAATVHPHIHCEEVVRPDSEVIPTGHEVHTWVQSLDGRPGIHVWQAGESMMGRSIVAVEATSPKIMPATRSRFLKPTLFINCRHHANEISGTNAAIQLLYELVTKTGEQGYSDILNDINIIVVPIENPDGVATLEEMLPEAPDHKLHAARYNSLGMEWYDQYFNPGTLFSEARVKTRLYERWLPEYMLDLHGVPSHEWEQPFAGYVNPNFREHWIPRSFVYAIMPFYENSDHPGGDESRALAAQLSTAMEQELDIVELNKEIYDRYARYAKAFEPETFNSEMAGSLVVVPTCERIGPTNFAIRKWPLVKSEIITEVLDEVAYGPWLARCTRAHLVVIETMIRRMQGAKKLRLKREICSNGVSFSWCRDSQ